VLAPRLIAIALFGILAVHLTNTFLKTVGQSLLQTNITKSLRDEVARIPGARLDEVTLVPRDGRTTVFASPCSPQTLSPEQVGALNDAIDAVARTTLELRVRSVIAEEITRQGVVYGPEPGSRDDSRR
jgi:hypothetical protein